MLTLQQERLGRGIGGPSTALLKCGRYPANYAPCLRITGPGQGGIACQSKSCSQWHMMPFSQAIAIAIARPGNRRHQMCRLHHAAWPQVFEQPDSDPSFLQMCSQGCFRLAMADIGKCRQANLTVHLIQGHSNGSCLTPRSHCKGLSVHVGSF